MDRPAEFSGSDEPETVLAEATGPAVAGGYQARLLKEPGAREIVSLPISAAEIDSIAATAFDGGAKITITWDGSLGLRFANGGLVVLPGAEALIDVFDGRQGTLIDFLNDNAGNLESALVLCLQKSSDPAALDAFYESVTGDARNDVAAAAEDVAAMRHPDGQARISSVFGGAGVGAPIGAITPVSDETTRWGRDDLKRGEFGEQGQNLTTGIGSAISHLVGLGDEEIGRRNGEKLFNDQNGSLLGPSAGVGSAIDHLWLLGDFDYVRSSRDVPEGDDVFRQDGRGSKIYGPLTDGTDDFALVEDNTFTGQIFDPTAAVLPARDIVTTMDPSHGTVVLNPDGTFVYTPSPNYSGITNFTYSFTDPRTGQTITGIVNLTVAAVADAPIVLGSAATNEDTPVGVPVTIGLRDLDGSETIESVVISGIPAGVTLSWNPAFNSLITAQPDGSYVVAGPLADMQALLASLQLDPPADFHGQVAFNVAVTSIESNADPRVPGYRDRETVNHTYIVNVEAVADPVSAAGDDETTNEDTLVHLDDLAATFGDSLDGSETHVVEIRGVDADAKITNAAGVEYPFVIAADGSKTYTLTPAQTGSVYFLPPSDESGTFAGMTIVAIATEGSNGDMEIASAPIRVVVAAVADPVGIVAPNQLTDEDTPVTFGDDISITVNDPATQDLTEVVVSGFPPGTVVTFIPAGGGPPQTIIIPAGGGSITLNGGSETEIRAALATLTLTPPPHADQNITLTIAATTTDVGGVTDTQTVAMLITVAAVADGPTLTGAASGDEDQPIDLPIAVSRIDADGSESYDFAQIAVPTGIMLLYPPVLPNGITVSISGGVYTFTPGPGTTAAQFENFLANDLQLDVPSDSDRNFDVTVKVGTIESVLSGGEVTLLAKDQSITIPVTVNPVIDAPTISGSSSINEDGIINPSNQTITGAVNFGANIAITAPDSSDGSERITAIVILGLPLGAVVTYTPVGGPLTTFMVTALTTSITLGGSGATEAQIRTALATLSLVPPPHSDEDIALGIAVTKTDGSTADPEAVTTQTFNATHVITVAAIADLPAGSGSGSGSEDENIPVSISVSHPDTSDGSETIKDVVIGNIPSGFTLGETSVGTGTLTLNLDGTYTVTGPDDAAISDVLANLQLVIDPVGDRKDLDTDFNLSVTVTTIESAPSEAGAGQVAQSQTSTSFNVPVTVTAVADAVTATGDSETTDEDTLVHLNDLATTFGDSLDGSEVHVIEIRGVDPDAKLTNATGTEYTFVLAGDGTKTYTVTAAQAGSVYFLPPVDVSGTFGGMTIVAIATESSNSDQEIASAPITVVVAAVADPVDITVVGQSTDEDTPVTFGDDITIVVADPVTQDLTEVVVSGFPAGTVVTYTPVGGGPLQTIVMPAGGGAVTLNGGTEAEIRAALATLTLTPPPHTDQNITLSIAVTTMDGAASNTQTVPMTITVAAVADGPNISGSASGGEDQPIDLPVIVSRIDADGSESYDFAEITVPSGVTLIYPPVPPTGILVSVAAGVVTFTPGPSTTAAQFENFLATGLQVQAPADSDVNFDVTVKVGTIESVLSGGEVTLLKKDLTNTIPVTVNPVTDMPTVTGSSTVDEDATTGFGANIAITRNDTTDGSESITQIILGNIPAAATVTYTETGGATVTVSTAGGFTSYTISGGTEDDIRDTLATFSLTPPLHSDVNIPVSVAITKVDQTTAEGEAAATTTSNTTHTIAVAAVADGPTISSTASGNEDQPINLPITVSRIDADASEQYDFATITVPGGVTLLYPGTLPNGISVSAAGDVYTFTPGAGTTAAQFQNFLATGLQVRAPADSDVNFDVTVTVGTIESVLSGGEVTLLTKDQSITIPVTVNPVIDAPTISGSSSVNEDGIVNPVDQSVTDAVNFGSNIAITSPDSTDASEAITQIVVTGLPVGAVVTYTPIGGSSTTFTVTAATPPVTLGGTGATEAEIRTALATLSLVPPPHSDTDITLGIAVTKSDATTTDPEAPISQTFTGTHVIRVAAVADVPTGSGSGAGNEDQNIPVSITVGHADASDGSEKIKDVVIGNIPAGFTLTESSAGTGVLTLNGNGTYTVTGPNDAAINDVLSNLSLAFVAGGARQHLDTEFNLSVTATTIESAVGAGQNALAQASFTFNVPVTVTAVVDGVSKSGSSVIVEDVARTIGSEIAYSKIDTDGTETVTSVVVSGFPAGAMVTYTDMLGNLQSFVSAGTETITLSGPKSAATETSIRLALDTLNIQAPLHSDADITLNVTVTTEDNDSSVTTQNFTHTVVVQAVADTPTVSASNISLNEDAITTLIINPGRSPDNDNSETLAVRVTVPADGSGPIGTLSGTGSGGVTFAAVSGSPGVYTVTATGTTPADRETALDTFLNGSITFTPRAQWSGVLTGTNGIRVEAISTENATGGQLAPGSFGGADLTSKTETATTYINVTVAAINDLPVLANASTAVNENNNLSLPSDPDLVIAIGTRLGLSIADTDGSQGLSMTLTGFPTNAQALAFAITLAGVTTNVDLATGTVTISGTNANNVLTVMNSLSITLADDRDGNFTISINGTSTDTNGVTPVNDAFSLTHTVTVLAVADTPTTNAGATTKTAVEEDSTYVTYPVTVALNDTDGSETYQSVVVQFSAPGPGARPEVQFGVTAGVTFVAVSGQVTLTGAAADIEAAMASLQVRPGADNGEDITVVVTTRSVESNPAEDNNGAAVGMGGGVAGPEISVPTAQSSQSFVIPVNPVPETPVLTPPASANGAEDTTFALGAFTVSSGVPDPDGSETRFIEFDTSSYPAGTTFSSGSIVTPGWLRVPESAFNTLTILPPGHYSGIINLSVRGVIVDTTTSGAVTSVTAPQTVPVTVTPDADGVSTPAASVGVEDTGPVAFGADLANGTTGIRVVDNTSGTGNNAATETISRIALDFPVDTAVRIYTITQGALVGTAQIAFDAGTRTYTITSTLITGAPDVSAVSQAGRAQAEADIRATLAGFTVEMGPTHSDLNGQVSVTATTLDVNGTVANTQDNTFTHTIRIQAVADTPSVTLTDPVVSTPEDTTNIPLLINPNRSTDDDNSETMSVRITVPSDAVGPVGTLVGTPPAGVTLTHLGGGVYLVEATGATAADRELALDGFLNGGGTSLVFDARPNWSGNLTGINGFRVEVISTEFETGGELAPGSFGGADSTSKTETVVDFIDIRVSPVSDKPTVKGNGVGLEDTLIQVPMSVTLNDKDGSESYTAKITSIVPSGTRVFGAGAAEIFPDGSGHYNLTPADVNALSVLPPLHYSSALSGDILLTVETTVTDSSTGGTAVASFTDVIPVKVVGDADTPGTRTISVVADEDAEIPLGSTILASVGGNLNNLLVDADGSEALSFVVGGLPAGVVPTSTSDPGGVSYLGGGAWSITAAAMTTLTLPPVPNFSGENPYAAVTVRAVTQELDGDQASSANWPVTITVNPVIQGGTVDGFATWGLGVTQPEGVTEAGANISLASAGTFTFVDNDGSEQVIEYKLDLSDLIADAGIGTRLEQLLGAGADLDDLIAAGFVTGTLTYDSGTGVITVLPANIGGISLNSQMFLDSNVDFTIPVTALIRDTAIIGGSPVFVDKLESGNLAVNLTGTADVPTVSIGGPYAPVPAGTDLVLNLGGDSTDIDDDDPATPAPNDGLGRTQSETIYYVLQQTNFGGPGQPAFAFVNTAGQVVGRATDDGTWIFTPAEIGDIILRTGPATTAASLDFQLTTVALDDGTQAINTSGTFSVTIDPGPGATEVTPGTPIIDLGDVLGGNEDASNPLSTSGTPLIERGAGDTTSSLTASFIVPAGVIVTGAIFNPVTGRWVASMDDVNNGIVQFTPPADFSGDLVTIQMEVTATSPGLQRVTTGLQTLTIPVDPVADGVAITASTAPGTEDGAIPLGITLAERDTDGSEVIGGFAYITLSSGATLIGGYATVAAGDADVTIDGTSLVGQYRVPVGDLATLQMQPANDWHGNVTVQVSAYSNEPVDATPDADNTQLDTATFVIPVVAVADAPLVTAPASVSGTEDTPIAITGLTAALDDVIATNGPEVLSVKITGVPDGARFSSGSNNGDGSWTIPVSALGTLTVTPPLNYSGTMTLTLVAIALELTNGSEAQSSVSFNVVVAPRADTVEILARDLTVNATAQVALDLNVRIADTTGTSPGENAAELVRITFTSVPTGVTLAATAGGTVSNPSAGTFVFTGTQAQANAILANVGATATGGVYDLTLSAVTIDGADTLAAPVLDGFRLTIPQVITGTTANDALAGAAGTQLIFGLAGNDTLNGGTGGDNLTGGTGNDTYVVDDAGDVIVELVGEGTTDTVQTTLSAYALGTNVERLTYTGAGNFTGTGNSLANTLTGGVGNDTLNGSAGADTLIGGAGNDTYVVDDAGDVITEGAGAGTDTVQTAQAVHALAANVENLTYTGASNFTGTGNTLANTLTGGTGNDTLNGGAGADTLTGGAGNDTYVVDNAGDIVTEGAAAGTDTVQTTLTAYALAVNVENVTYTGASNFAGTGNTLANTLTGGTGNDTLNGGTGADTLIGGAGNDTYVVDDAGDIITEGAAAGTDTVQSALSSYTLTGNTENLVLTGSANINGTGNGLDNTLTGNSGNNVLSGGAGADTLNGGGGADMLLGGTGIDILSGGAGIDTFSWASGEAGTGVDSITDFTNGAGGDELDLSALLVGFTGSSVLSDFVQSTSAGGNTTIRVDVNGTVGGSNYTDLVVLQGVVSVDLDQMRTNANLLV